MFQGTVIDDSPSSRPTIGEGENHDGIVERHLAQGEVRFSLGEVGPNKNHCGTRRCGEDHQSGD